MVDENRFAFKGGPVLSRRTLVTGGAARAASATVGSGEAGAVADPAIEEAEHIGRSFLYRNSGGANGEAFLRKAMAKHPQLNNHVEHAVKAMHREDALSSKHGKFVSRWILGPNSDE